MYKTASRKQHYLLNKYNEKIEENILMEDSINFKINKKNQIEEEIEDIVKYTDDFRKSKAYFFKTITNLKEDGSNKKFISEIRRRYKFELKKEDMEELILKISDYFNILNEIKTKK